MPSMWIFPDEHKWLFSTATDRDEAIDSVTPTESADSAMSAGDGGDLIEVSIRDLARRCLELIGVELGLST